MFQCFRPILFLTFFNSLKCVGSLIEKFYIQTVPGTKHHRFLVSLIFLLHLSFFRHNKRLRRVEHLQRKETLSSEPYFSISILDFLFPLKNEKAIGNYSHQIVDYGIKNQQICMQIRKPKSIPSRYLRKDLSDSTCSF